MGKSVNKGEKMRWISDEELREIIRIAENQTESILDRAIKLSHEKFGSISVFDCHADERLRDMLETDERENQGVS
jgi:hypothetical protein